MLRLEVRFRAVFTGTEIVASLKAVCLLPVRFLEAVARTVDRIFSRYPGLLWLGSMEQVLL